MNRKTALHLCLVACLAMGCASSTEPRAEHHEPHADPEPERVAPRAAEPAAESAPSGDPAPAAAAEPEALEDEDGLTVVIDPGAGGAGTGSTLAEASRAERERRRTAGRATVVITDENLDEFQEGQVTEAAVSLPPAPERGEPGETGDDPLLYQEEQYWREQALNARLRWRNALDEISRLELRANELRRRFYAEDDPYYRDSQVKPEWDRTLDRLGEAREQAQASRVEVRDLMERGRRAGALPGWLREGIELEPEPPEPKDRRDENGDYYEAEEPVELDPDRDPEDGGARR